MYQVTVAIPLYNAEDYIKIALSSVLKQTLKDIEILIINDCSTDNSLSVVEEINKSKVRDDCFIRIISLPNNIGIGAVRNIAITEANSKYLFFLDSDDYISETCLKLMHTKAEEIEADVVFASMQKIYKGYIEQIGII